MRDTWHGLHPLGAHRVSLRGRHSVNLHLVEAAVTTLPQSYEPLLLTFYRPPLKVVEGAAVIGTDEGSEFRIDLASGRVSSVDPKGVLPSRFVNSTINQLADAIAAHREYASRVCNVDEADASRVVQELRRRLTVADAAATSDPEAWWSLILEQAKNGLL
jgi:SUKH-4 immunity protein